MTGGVVVGVGDVPGEDVALGEDGEPAPQPARTARVAATISALMTIDRAIAIFPVSASMRALHRARHLYVTDSQPKQAVASQ
jgi:hypothetical protein